MNHQNNNFESVGVHHLNVPHGPEGCLIAYHLYQALKTQGASMELTDGTFVAPEVLLSVLSGPEGFGDWQSTKFVIVLPVSEPIKNSAQEYFQLRDELAQAQLAMEDAQQRYQQALTKLGKVVAEEPRTPGWAHGKMFHANVTDTQTPNFFDPAKTETRACDFDSAIDHPVYVPENAQLDATGFPLDPQSILGKQRTPNDERVSLLSGAVIRRKPWTFCGNVVKNPHQAPGKVASLNTTPAWMLYNEAVRLDPGVLFERFGLDAKEVEAFKFAYANNVLVTMAPQTEEGFSFGSEKPLALVGHYQYYDDFVQYPKQEESLPPVESGKRRTLKTLSYQTLTDRAMRVGLSAFATEFDLTMVEAEAFKFACNSGHKAVISIEGDSFHPSLLLIEPEKGFDGCVCYMKTDLTMGTAESKERTLDPEQFKKTFSADTLYAYCKNSLKWVDQPPLTEKELCAFADAYESKTKVWINGDGEVVERDPLPEPQPGKLLTFSDYVGVR